MAKPKMFQFTLTNETVIKKIKAIPTKYWSLCMEMAFDAWFEEEKKHGGYTISYSVLTTSRQKNPSPTRFRISFSNKNIISTLIDIHPRYRSIATEMALKTWFESKSGAKLFEFITARNKSQSTVLKNENSKIEKSNNAQNVQVQTEKLSEAERLIKIALEFK